MSEPAYLDGNAAAGPLSEIFAVDVTTARGHCGNCGDETVVARAHLYPDDHGLVLRCSVCEGVLARVVQTPGRISIDLRGLSWLELDVE